jgi:hypothetical protein
MSPRLTLPLALFVLVGCASSPPATTPATQAPPVAADERPSRPELSAEQCEAQGGTVVGDIGDGATQRAEYSCPSGVAPKGNIAAPPDGPVSIEGAVCCPAR